MKSEKHNEAMRGNKWWELRSKHGRKKIFETPQIMWDAACEYFEHTEGEEQWNEQHWVGKEGVEVTKNHPTPFTMQGLCLFLGVNTVYFNHFENGLKGKDDEMSKDFSQVITRIREVIYKQKFEGATVGAYNANIIARDLGLKDKNETEHSGGIDLNGTIEVSYRDK